MYLNYATETSVFDHKATSNGLQFCLLVVYYWVVGVTMMVNSGNMVMIYRSVRFVAGWSDSGLLYYFLPQKVFKQLERSSSHF